MRCNVTRASEALHIAQPTVSQAVAEMEGYYGVRLFERLSRRLHLTAAGERFRSYASHVAALFDEMEKGLRDWDSFGMLRVGASITIGSQLLPDFGADVFRPLSRPGCAGAGGALRRFGAGSDGK